MNTREISGSGKRDWLKMYEWKKKSKESSPYIVVMMCQGAAVRLETALIASRSSFDTDIEISHPIPVDFAFYCGEVIFLLFFFCFFKRKRCVISNQSCKILDGKYPVGRFARTNSRPRRFRLIPNVRFVAASTDHPNLPVHRERFLFFIDISILYQKIYRSLNSNVLTWQESLPPFRYPAHIISS